MCPNILVLFGLISILIFTLLLMYSKPLEHYDARYTGMSFAKCAEFCKTTANCAGFGYDKENEICYPSQTTISGRPLDSIFRREYSYNNAVCNKVDPIVVESKVPTFDMRRKNSVFACSETSDKQPQFYFHNKAEFTNIGEGKNIDEIFDVDEYEVRPYSWPRSRFDFDQLDLLIKERESQTFSSNNVTDLNRVIDFSPKQEQIQIIPSRPKITIEYDLDFNLGKIRDQVVSGLKASAPKLLIPSSKFEVKMPPSVANPRYEQTNLFNKGQYQRDYKCVRNVPLQSCLNYCSNHSDCVGVEWNRLFDSTNNNQGCEDSLCLNSRNFDPNFGLDYPNKNIQNICCPYRTIGDLIKRTDNQTYGNFYKKIIS